MSRGCRITSICPNNPLPQRAAAAGRSAKVGNTTKGYGARRTAGAVSFLRVWAGVSCRFPPNARGNFCHSCTAQSISLRTVSQGILPAGTRSKRKTGRPLCAAAVENADLPSPAAPVRRNALELLRLAALTAFCFSAAPPMPGWTLIYPAASSWGTPLCPLHADSSRPVRLKKCHFYEVFLTFWIP